MSDIESSKIPNISIQKIGKNENVKDLKSSDVHSGFSRKLFKASEKTGHILPRLFSAITGMVLGTLYVPRIFYDFPNNFHNFHSKNMWGEEFAPSPLEDIGKYVFFSTWFPIVGLWRGAIFFQDINSEAYKSFALTMLDGNEKKSLTTPNYFLFNEKERQEKADQSILYKLGRILKSYKIKLQKLIIPTPEQIKETIIEKYQIKNKILNQLNEYNPQMGNKKKMEHFVKFEKGIRIEVNQENKIEEKKNKKEDIDAFQVKIDFFIGQKLGELKALNNLIEKINNNKITTIEGLRQHINNDSKKKEGVKLSDTEKQIQEHNTSIEELQTKTNTRNELLVNWEETKKKFNTSPSRVSS